MPQIDSIDQPMARSHYRWIVLSTIFVGYVICMADRSNIGTILPMVRSEFGINNFTAGAVSSLFFLGYAISQIPAGLVMGKKGTRTIVSVAILGFSVITFLLGHSVSAVMLLVLRLVLGLIEGATPVGMTSTINAWFPFKEKGTATGVYIASTMLAPILAPIVATQISTAYGWRNVFIYVSAIPAFIMAFVFFFVVRSHPWQSKHVNKAELEHITGDAAQGKGTARDFGNMGVLDKIIRLKSLKPLQTNKEVLSSWSIWGVTLAYFCMNNVLYGMITWIPSYLHAARGYDVISMGWMSSMPYIGGFVGALLGGVVSDKVFHGRRKPTMMLTAILTAVMMGILLVTPDNSAILALVLILAGFFLNIGWSSFTSVAMNMTTTTTYPFAISIINSGGNLGGFFSPMIVGAVLDLTGNYTVAFSYFVFILIAAFIILLTLHEFRPSVDRTAAVKPIAAVEHN
ncbi:MAG: MFS transporter [Bifidobacteriaceae bacterium]|jgi:sugar phosphate permease|nr:MFS transporter [Bifidobacteriaceae bacterium]MCI1978551.1 MFS transporter [Bifidobacteriaceae bacterium]